MACRHRAIQPLHHLLSFRFCSRSSSNPLFVVHAVPFSPKLSSSSYFFGDSRLRVLFASSAHRHQHHTSAGPAPSGIRSMRLNPPPFTAYPRLESPLRRTPSIPSQVQLQASTSDVSRSGVRGAPQLTRVLDLEFCRLSPFCSLYVSSMTTIAGLPTPLAAPSTPPCRSSPLLSRQSSQFIGFFDRGRLSQFVHEMGPFHFAMDLTSLTKLQGLHLFLAVSQPTLMWGGLVSLANFLKIFGGFTRVFTETDLHTEFHFSCLKSSLYFHLPVDSPKPSSSSSCASFVRSGFPPNLWRCLSISITVLLSCGAVRLGPGDAAGFASISFRGADRMSTSQYKVTISLLSDHVAKVVLTHSSTVLSSLSSSSFEDLSLLSYIVLVYAFNQRGWIIPSVICNQAV